MKDHHPNEETQVNDKEKLDAALDRLFAYGASKKESVAKKKAEAVKPKRPAEKRVQRTS